MNELTVDNILRLIKSQKLHYSTMAGIKGYEKCSTFHECLCILTNDIDTLLIKPKPKEDGSTNL